MVRDGHRTRTVLCIRNDVLRAGLRALLNNERLVHVVAECSDITELVATTTKGSADVVLVDHAIAPLPALRQRRGGAQAEIGVVQLIGEHEPAALAHLRPPGVHAILPVPSSTTELFVLVDAVRAAARGCRWTTPGGPDESTLQRRQPGPPAPEHGEARTSPGPLHDLPDQHQRMLLLDNHPSVRLALQTLVGPYQDFEVVGEHATIMSALDSLSRVPVDIVVMELELLDIAEWQDFCTAVHSAPCAPRILIYSAQNSADYIAEAIRAGVDSYVHKGVECASVLNAIRRTCAGERVWLIGAEGALTKRDQVDALDKMQLTRREREIIVPLLSRHSNEEIARELCLATQTVKNHVSNILRKAGVHSRRELFGCWAAISGSSPDYRATDGVFAR